MTLKTEGVYCFMKNVKRVLCVLFALLLCFSALSVAASAKASDFQQGQTFRFGWYPQMLVSRSALAAELTKISGGKNVAVKDGKVYRSLTVNEPTVPGGGYFALLYDYNYGETYWFECQPIEWLVLENAADGVLLLAKDVLDTHVFNTAVRSDNTWENSDVRAWLNGAFMDTAFSPAEKAFILSTPLTNEDNPVHGSYNGVPSAYKGDVVNGVPYQGTESGNDTIDRVFLPSFNEITNKAYGFNANCNQYGDFGEFVGYYEYGEASGRQADATDYARCHGIWANQPEEDDPNLLGHYRYWLRTAGYENGYAAGVLEDGRVSTGWPVNYNILGIRPMIRVSPDAVLNIQISSPAGDELRYREPNVQLFANTDVIWSSDNEDVATIDQNGNITIHSVGTVNITATLPDDPTSFATAKLEIQYEWWQWLILIFLFGWIWY